jgi:3-deoxy-manno-octulosonate cytidylyltransferase (CMP-KDO synthetase)
MTAAVVIPARYHSTRFPGKPLATLNGIPLIQHVYQNARDAKLAQDVIVATDSENILESVLSFGGTAVLTSDKHVSGTDRIAEVARSLKYDIIVNVQGDEPLIKPGMIDDVITLLEDRQASIGTLAITITDRSEIFDPNVVKVVFDKAGYALYFSRAPIPYHRDTWNIQNAAVQELRPEGAPREGTQEDRTGSEQFKSSGSRCFKHLGIYSYRKDILIQLSEMPQSRLERIEKLEQLRALENNIIIKVKEACSDTIGVDTPEDLERVKKCLNISL